MSGEALAGSALLLGAGGLAYGATVAAQAEDERRRLKDIETGQEAVRTQLEAVARFEEAVATGDARFPVGNADLPTNAAPSVSLKGEVFPVRGDVVVTESLVTVQVRDPYVRSAQTLGVGLSSSTTQETLDVRVRRPLYTALVGDGVPPSADPNAHQYATIAAAVAAGQGASIRVIGRTTETADIAWPASARLLLSDGAEVRVEGGRWSTATPAPTRTSLSVTGQGLLVLASNAGGDWASGFASVGLGRGLSLQVLGTQRLSALAEAALEDVRAVGTGAGNLLVATAPLVTLRRCTGAPSTLGLTAVATGRVLASRVTGWGALDLTAPEVRTRRTTSDLTVRGCALLRSEGDARASLLVTDPPAAPAVARTELYGGTVTASLALSAGATPTPGPHEALWDNVRGGANVDLGAGVPLAALRCAGAAFGTFDARNTDGAGTWHLQRCRFGGRAAGAPPPPAATATPDLLVQGCDFGGDLDWQPLPALLEVSDCSFLPQATVTLGVARLGSALVLRNRVPAPAQDAAQRGVALALRGGHVAAHDNALGPNATVDVTTSTTGSEVDWRRQGVSLAGNALARAAVLGTFDLHNVRVAGNAFEANAAVVPEAGVRVGLAAGFDERANNLHVSENLGGEGGISTVLGGGANRALRFTRARVTHNETGDLRLFADPLEEAQVTDNRCTGDLSLQHSESAFGLATTLLRDTQVARNNVAGALGILDLGTAPGPTPLGDVRVVSCRQNLVRGLVTVGPNSASVAGLGAVRRLSFRENTCAGLTLCGNSSRTAPMPLEALTLARLATRGTMRVGWTSWDSCVLRRTQARVGNFIMFGSFSKPNLVSLLACNRNVFGGLTINGSGGVLLDSTFIGNVISSAYLGSDSVQGNTVAFNRAFSSISLECSSTGMQHCCFYGNRTPSESQIGGGGPSNRLCVVANTVDSLDLECFPQDSWTNSTVVGNNTYFGNPGIYLTPASTADRGSWVFGNVTSNGISGFDNAETQLAGQPANRVAAP